MGVSLVGKTMPSDGSSDEDLSIDILVTDLVNLLQIVFPDPSKAPSFFVGVQYLSKNIFSKCTSTACGT